jgi:(S)-ureidoglycine aminohydrolase
VVVGVLKLSLAGKSHTLQPGGYAFIPPDATWSVKNAGSQPVRFHWIRKAYERVEGIAVPEAFVVNEKDIAPWLMPDTNGVWATTLRQPDDMRHDMHVTIVTFEPGASSFCRDPCDGARALCAGGQGGLPAQPGLG